MIVAALIFGAMFTIVALLSRMLAKWAIRKLEEKNFL